MKKYGFRRILGLGLALVLAVSAALPISAKGLLTSADEKNPYKDISSSDWYYNDVLKATNKGLMNGLPDGRFDPRGLVTRGMLVTILHRSAGEPEAEAAAVFTDVSAGKYYANAVIWAAEQEVVNGYGKGLFGPEDSITREQLALILWRYAQKKDISVAANGGVLPDFPDRGNISDWAGEAVSWAYNRGLLQLRGEKMAPSAAATRAEAASAVVRFLDLKADNGSFVDK